MFKPVSQLDSVVTLVLCFERQYWLCSVQRVTFADRYPCSMKVLSSMTASGVRVHVNEFEISTRNSNLNPRVDLKTHESTRFVSHGVLGSLAG